MTSMDYLLTVGGYMIVFLALALLLFRALTAATSIESVVMALPF